MRPETKTEFVIAMFVLLVGLGCAILAKTAGIHHAATWSAFGSMGVLVSIYFGARHLRRASPFTKAIKQTDWMIVHQNSHRGVVVRVPASEHQRGQYPKVEFQRGNTPQGSTNLEWEADPNTGDIEVFHPMNSFTPPSFKECIVVVRA